MVYFDHNATTPMLPEAEAAFLAAARDHYANPSSPHRAGARARAEMEEHRERLATLLGADAREIIFTSGATEGVNAVLRHFAAVRENGTVLVSAVEHPCVRAAARAFWDDRTIPLSVDAAGRLHVDDVAARLSAGKTTLVAVMAANNETGVVQPWTAIAEQCHAAGVVFLCDAVQWCGRLPIEPLLGNTVFVGSAHKFGGPKGVGFIRLPSAVEGFRASHGGEQEDGRRAGTENLPAVAGMVAAFENAAARAGDTAAVLARFAFRQAFAERMAAIGGRVTTVGAETLWNTVSLTMPHSPNHRWVNRLSRRGFMVSTGSACATGRDGPSHVLSAMGVGDEAARRTLRVSSGWTTTAADWDALATAFEEVAREPRETPSGSHVIEIPE